MNDAPAIQALITRHGRALLLFARTFLPTHADAEDAVQEAFLRFWPRRNHAIDTVALLYSCTRSAAIDAARKHNRAQRRDRRTTLETCFAAADQIEADELHALAQRQLDSLPDEQREVLVLKIWADLTFDQIASALSISPNTAASRYRYALEKLAAAWPCEVRHG